MSRMENGCEIIPQARMEPRSYPWQLRLLLEGLSASMNVNDSAQILS